MKIVLTLVLHQSGMHFGKLYVALLWHIASRTPACKEVFTSELVLSRGEKLNILNKFGRW
jgi:hypothetical protein